MTSINSVVSNNQKPLTKVKLTNSRSEKISQTTSLVKFDQRSDYSQTQSSNYSQDAVRNYLQTIGKVSLLTAEAEIELSRQARDLLELEAIRQQLAEKLGREPNHLEWSQQVGLTPSSLHRRLYLGRKAKNEMIRANLRLVVFIAKKYLKRGLSLQDLIQEGNLGLIKAVERFEPEKGCKFSTYAYWWIRQSIIRAIVEQSRTIRLPIHIHDKLSLIKKTFKLLSQQLQRQPSEQEMAEYLDISVERLQFLLKVGQAPFSLEVSVDGEEDSRRFSEAIESDVPTPEDWIIRKLRREEVDKLLNYLSSQEREVVSSRFGLDDGVVKTSAEIAENLNLSRKQINRIRAKAMNKLRRLCFAYDFEDYLA
ncbi:MAG: sigma-70 family RNA polymerase sigma factor [Pleurocapsa sp.]